MRDLVFVRCTASSIVGKSKRHAVMRLSCGHLALVPARSVTPIVHCDRCAEDDGLGHDAWFAAGDRLSIPVDTTA
jgi:hypothetical protein